VSEVKGPEEGASEGRGGWRKSFVVRRLLPLVAVVVAAAWFLRDVPKETTLVYRLGRRSQELVELRVDLLRLPEKTLARHVEYRFSPTSPAPIAQSHPTRLSEGAYALEATLVYPERTQQVARSFRFSGEERITIDLED